MLQLSKTTSQRLYQAIHDSIVNVHEKSFGDKAVVVHQRDGPERGRCFDRGDAH